MTLPTEPDPDNKDPNSSHDGAAKGSGKALEPAKGGLAEDASVAPFLAAAGERVEVSGSARPLHNKLLDYSAHAAMIVGLLGFAWTISEHVGNRPTDPPAPVKIVAAPAVPLVDEAAELRKTNQKMAADISALRLSLEALRTSVRQDKTTDQIRSLASNLDGVKSGLNATKSETSAALAQLATKIDHLPHTEATAKIQQIVDRLDRMERQNADQTPTASVASSARSLAPVAVPPVKPPQVVKAAPQTEAAEAETPKKIPTGKDAPVAEIEAPKKPDMIAGWVVREVYDGIAVVESKRGPMEVTPGSSIPGAGVVRSIERHGSGWTVMTSKGQIAYLPPPRDHGPRDYYRSAPDDF